MRDILGFTLIFVPPFLGLLAAMHFRAAFRSSITNWLLVAAIIVFATAALQLLVGFLLAAFAPGQGTLGWKMANWVAYVTWPQMLGNVVFFGAVYLLSRELSSHGRRPTDGQGATRDLGKSDETDISVR